MTHTLLLGGTEARDRESNRPIEEIGARYLGNVYCPEGRHLQPACAVLGMLDLRRSTTAN